MNQIAHIEGSLFTNAIWYGKRTGIVRDRKVSNVVSSEVKDHSGCLTVFPSLYNTKEAKYMLLEDVVERIKNGNSKDMVEKVRKGDKKAKLLLPAICFSGIFSQRCEAGLVKHSGLVCLDFDKVPDVNKFKENICKCKYVRSAFISPSGDGVKVIIKIDGDPKTVIHTLDKYFDSEYLDLQDDACRVCFESHDPDIYYNPKSLKFNGK